MFRKKGARFSVIKKKSIEIDKFYFTFPPSILIVDFQNFWSQNNNVKENYENWKGRFVFVHNARYTHWPSILCSIHLIRPNSLTTRG